MVSRWMSPSKRMGPSPSWNVESLLKMLSIGKPSGFGYANAAANVAGLMEMKRERYPGVFGKVIGRLAMLAAGALVPAFVAGIYVHEAYQIKWASTALPAFGFVIFAVVSHFLLREFYKGLPCPTCGKTNLPQSKSKDGERWHLLTCEDCETEWMTGLGES